MNPAQATRLEKEKHPERFCGNSRCLWRRKHLNGSDSPCPKHGPTIDLMEALKKSLKAEAAKTAKPEGATK